MSKNLIVVLGMHRSGTSALTKLLNMMGVYLGEDDQLMSIEGLEDNPKGHFEFSDITALNDELIVANKFLWCKINKFNVGLLTQASIDRYIQQLTPLLQRLTQRSDVVAIKDPRMCLLLPLWRKHFDYNIKLVFITRNPVEVALSLCRRDGIPAQNGIALWTQYNLKALDSAQGLPCCFVNHEDVIRHPYEVIKRLAAFLDKQHVSVSLPTEQEVQQFIDPGLHRQSVATLKWQSMLSLSQMQLYVRLRSGDASDVFKTRSQSQGHGPLKWLAIFWFRFKHFLRKLVASKRVRFVIDDPALREKFAAYEAAYQKKIDEQNQ